MASLREIAAANAEEIRDGIAWVIVWKTGRSWHAKPVWLNSETDKLGPEDEKQVQEILQQDPNAVMINGYYSGHLGESMTLKELEDGIRWHYEKDIRLRNSTIFEHPEEEREGHPDVLGQASRSYLFKKPKVYKAGNRGSQSAKYAFRILSRRKRRQAVCSREPP